MPVFLRVLPLAFAAFLSTSLAAENGGGASSGAAPAIAPPEPITEARLEALFRPPLGEQMALSRDGKYLAYTEHAGTDLAIVIFDLEQMKRKTRIIADEDRPILHTKEKKRSALRFLGWADGGRLVFAPTIEIIESATSPDTVARARQAVADAAALAGESPLDLDLAPAPPTIFAPIMAVDADGTHPSTLADAKQFTDEAMHAPNILGFAAGKPRTALLIEVNGWNDTRSTVYRLDVRTGKKTRTDAHTDRGDYLYDWNGKSRFNYLENRQHTVSYFVQPPGSSAWKPLTDAPAPGGKFLLTPETYWGERVVPLGLDFAPDVLLYASNVGRDTFGVYGMNLKTRERTAPTLEVPGRDLVALDESLPSRRLVFDEFREKFAGVRVAGVRPTTIWADEELAALQRSVEHGYPGENIQLAAWNEARTRFLVQVSGGKDPGRTYLFRRPEKSMVQLTRRAPWLADNELHDTKLVAIPGPDGSHLTAYVTMPRRPRLRPVPLILWFAPGLPPVPQREFEPQAQVFADMGFIVCRLNQRGVLGTGRHDRDALRHDPNRVPLADARATVEWLAHYLPIDRKRVVTYGEGTAGYFAIRAAELQPEVFRCAVAFDPVLNFTSWVNPPLANASGDMNLEPPSFTQQVNRLFFEQAGVKISDLSLADETLSVPVFMAVRRPRSEAETALAAGVNALRLKLGGHGVAAATVEYDEAFAQGLPAARARVYRELQEFLNLNLYNFNVKIGPTEVVK